MVAQSGTPSKHLEVVHSESLYGGIVRGLLSGNSAAASALYRHFGQRVNRLVWKLLGADQEHDDVVQQVFIQVLGSIKTLSDPERLESWIIGVTVHTVRKEIRKRQIHRRLMPFYQWSRAEPQTRDPETALLARQFYQVLETLKTDDRIVFSLFFIEGYTLSEIAEVGQYSLPTAKRKLKHARLAMMKRIRKDPVLAGWVEELDREEASHG